MHVVATVQAGMSPTRLPGKSSRLLGGIPVLGMSSAEADIGDVVSRLREDPSLLKTGAHVRQEPAEEASSFTVVRCDGDSRLGLGHVVRCLAVASALVEHHRFGVLFAMSERGEGSGLVEERGFPVHIRPQGESESEWIGGLLAKRHAAAVFLDVRTDLAAQSLRDWRDAGLLVALIDDVTDRRLASDVVFYPPVPQVDDLGWGDARTVRHVGWDWVALRQSFAEVTPQQHDDKRVLLAMGGADPAGMATVALDALRGVNDDVAVTVMLGKAFRQEERVRKVLAEQDRASEVLRDIADPAPVMACCDAAVCTFGVTAYELAAIGVPAIHLCLNDDHLASSSAFMNEGIAAASHLAGDVSREGLGREIDELVADTARRASITMRARGLVDGCGARRIATEIATMTRNKDV